MATSDDHALLLQISYDLKRLQSQSDKARGIVDKGLSDMEKRAKRAAQEVEESLSFKNVNGGFALNQIFIGLKERAAEGGSELGVLGGALTALGPIGLAAGAAVAAGMVAIERSMKAAEWAEGLEHASRSLGLTTTQLQLFDFWATSAGVPVDRMRESMAGLVKQVGLVEAGLARSMSVKAFTDGLKITPEQLRGWGTLEQQLPHILDAAAKLNVEERAGIASRLKVDPDVLNSLIEVRDDLKSLTDKAREYGIVMDEATVKKTAEAAKEMKVASAVITGELNIAFAHLAPLAASAAGKLVDIITATGDLARGVKDTLKPLDDLLARLGLISAKGNNADVWRNMISMVPGGDLIMGLMDRGRADRLAAAKKPLEEGSAGGPPARELSSTKAKGGVKTDNTSALTTMASEDLDKADKALQEALKGLTADVQARAGFESKAIDAAARVEQDKLAGDRRRLLADKTIEGKTSDILQAKIEQAQADVELARIAKQDLLKRQTALQLAEQQQAMRSIEADGQIDLLRSEQGIWQTTAKRRDLALQLFDLEEKQHEDVLKAQIAQAQIAKDKQKEAELTAELANSRNSAGLRREGVSQANPANSWDAWVQDAQNATRDVGEAFARMKVSAIETFNASLFDSQGKLRSIGDIARSVGQDFVKNAEQFGLKKLEAGLFGGQGGAGGFLGGLFGGKGSPTGLAGDQVPKGTQNDPLFVQMAGASGAAGGGGLLDGLFGGGSKGGGPGGFLSSLLGGGSASAGGAEGLASFAGLFASGGNFTVGGPAGVDRNLAVMRFTRGENVAVQTEQQQRDGSFGGGDVHQHFNFPGASADGFRKTRRQWARDSKLAMQF